MNEEELHSESAEEGIGMAILDMMAQECTFSGVFFVRVDDDEGFTVQMLEMQAEEFDIEELN
jgi:hypothetical protein